MTISPIPEIMVDIDHAFKRYPHAGGPIVAAISVHVKEAAVPNDDYIRLPNIGKGCVKAGVTDCDRCPFSDCVLKDGEVLPRTKLCGPVADRNEYMRR